ncbi:telomere repeat-binding factor 4-like [Sorghum bicolor]|nr:telomere repeat-binding factor 4-like [Sorghum bicolor]|eukprot:XP_021313130.1 telomere repeat-binding factor 4-like [Sorghum bicolor]
MFYTSRKNNSRWTAKEVERLVQGVSKFGVGRWTNLKQNFFKRSIRTAVNLKDKWRNLLKTYQEGSQKTTQLHLEPSLVERIRKLAEKQQMQHI